MLLLKKVFKIKSTHYGLHIVHSRGSVTVLDRSLIIYLMDISSKILTATVALASRRRNIKGSMKQYKRSLLSVIVIQKKAVAQCSIAT